MNDHDSSRIASLLEGEAYSRTEEPGQADLIILNTCSIRDKAEHKVYSTLGRLRTLKERNPALIIAVGGCVAQQEGIRLIERFPGIDLVFGPRTLGRFASLLDAVKKGDGPLVDTTLSERPRLPAYSIGKETSLPQATAHVAIMQGCDNFCAYCIVPYVRGREFSRPLDEVLDDVGTIAEEGVKEITLLGQNVNGYGKTLPDKPSFASLLRRIHEIDGIERIRFVTSHPRDFSAELIDTFGRLPKLCEHLHLPVQAGSDAVLKRMNRGYTRQEYLDKVERLRATRPEIGFSSDIIVGFPGETEKDFQETLALVETVSYDSLFSFRYSPRPGTPAAGFDGELSESVKQERLARLQSFQRRVTFEKNQELVGMEKEVLVTGPNRKESRDLSGRTRCNRVVHFRGPRDLVGRLVSIRIDQANKNSLRGTVINP